MPSPVALPMPKRRRRRRSSVTAFSAASQTRQMLNEIEGEEADEIDGEHLGAEGRGELRPVRDLVAIGNAELAVAVDRGGAHQIADRLDRGLIGLASFGERVEHVIEEAHAAIGAREHELGRKIAPRLLPRHVRGETRDVMRRGHAVEEHEGRVPGFRDHAIRALLGRELMAEGDEAEDAALDFDRVDRRADAAFVDVECNVSRRASPRRACGATRREGSSAASDARCRDEQAASPHPAAAARASLGRGSNRHRGALRQTRCTWM